MYSDQARELMSSGAAMRREIWGVNPAGNLQLARMEIDRPDPAATFRCYFSSGKTQEALETMMIFKDVHDNAVRVAKTEQNCDPTIGKTIRLLAANQDGTDLLVLIEEVQTSALNPEWVLGCKNSF